MNKDLEEIFKDYIRDGSGGGSTLEYTVNLRQQLKKIFVDFNIKTLLDAPCGDMVWMDQVLKEHPKLNYIGGEILGAVVTKHTKTYKKNPKINFLHLDITEDPLPACDLWIARDVLFHLTHDKSINVFKNMARSDIKYILTSTHGLESVDYQQTKWSYNKPIIDGHFQLINLFAEPFCLPEPLFRFDDTFGPHPKREMCIWSKEQIVQMVDNK